MKKIILTFVFIVISAQSALALSVSAHGGAYVPLSDYGNNFNTGYNYGLAIEHELFFFTSLKANYHRYHADGKKNTFYNGSELDGDAIELMIKFAPFDFIVEPYISAGGGYYNNKVKFSNNKVTYDGFGFIGEAGLNVNFFIMSAGIHAKYIYSEFNSGPKNMESVNVGATFTIHIPFI